MPSANASASSIGPTTALRSTLVAMLLAGSASLLGHGAGAQESVELKLHHMQSAMAPSHRRMLVPWAERIYEESGGRLAIEVYPSNLLGGQAQALIDQARDGIVDIVWTTVGYTSGRYPEVEVFELPYMFSNPIAMNRALTEFLHNHPEVFPEHKILASFVHGGQVLHSRVPIRTVEDLEGLKTRMPTRISAWAVEATGGVPIGMPVPKVPEMLSKGLVDAVLLPYEGTMAFRVHEIVDYHVNLGFAPTYRLDTTVFVLAMNPGAYEALPEDLRAVIDANSGAALDEWFGEIWIGAEEPGRTLAEESGEVYILPLEEREKLRDQLEEPVTRRWLAAVAEGGIDGRPLIEEARTLITKYEEMLGPEEAGAASPYPVE